MTHHADVGWDWVGSVTTAVVGLAGIGAALWTGSRERLAQERHARREERRSAYANLFACADRVTAAAKRVEALSRSGAQPEQAAQAGIELGDLRLTFNTAVYELAMSAPPQVTQLAEELRSLLRAKAKAAVDPEANEADITSRHLRGKLLEAMRADIGHGDDTKPRAKIRRDSSRVNALGFGGRAPVGGDGVLDDGTVGHGHSTRPGHGHPV